MATSAAKKLRLALVAGFEERGWWSEHGDDDYHNAPESVVSKPLSLQWYSAVEPSTFGGVTFVGDAILRSEQVTDVLLTFPLSSLTTVLESRIASRGVEHCRGLIDLGSVSVGQLLDQNGNYMAWTVGDAAEMRTVLAEFFAMVDGPLAKWVLPRDSVDKVLDSGIDGQVATTDALHSRTLPVLALLNGDAGSARLIVARYRPTSAADSEERYAACERQLADRLGSYGAVQRG